MTKSKTTKNFKYTHLLIMGLGLIIVAVAYKSQQDLIIAFGAGVAGAALAYNKTSK